MNEKPILMSTLMVQAILDGRKTQTRRVVKNIDHSIDRENLLIRINGAGVNHKHIKCPYGKVGDVLWVKERWAKIIDDENELIGYHHSTDSDVWQGPWKPSIHMPKDACRIWLEITAIRVERLQDISEDDAKAEGVEFAVELRGKDQYVNYLDNSTIVEGAKYSFQTLWHKINGTDSWEANPWVWVVEFKVLSSTGKPKFIQKGFKKAEV